MGGRVNVRHTGKNRFTWWWKGESPSTRYIRRETTARSVFFTKISALTICISPHNANSRTVGRVTELGALPRFQWKRTEYHRSAVTAKAIILKSQPANQSRLSGLTNFYYGRPCTVWLCWFWWQRIKRVSTLWFHHVAATRSNISQEIMLSKEKNTDHELQ